MLHTFFQLSIVHKMERGFEIKKGSTLFMGGPFMGKKQSVVDVLFGSFLYSFEIKLMLMKRFKLICMFEKINDFFN